MSNRIDSATVLYSAGKNDEMYTPKYAVKPILPYVKKDWVVWCPFDTAESEFVKEISKTNKVIASHIIDGEDFYEYEPDEHWDCIVSNPPFCYDKGTEVLTKSGWRFIKDVKVGESVMSVDVETQDICYTEVIDTTNQRYKGDMYSVESKYMDLKITPNHRMVAYKKGRPYLDSEGKDLVQVKDMEGLSHMRRDGYKWKGKEVEDFIIPEHTIDIDHVNDTVITKTYPEKRIKMDDWLAFLGIFIADGFSRGSCGGTSSRYTVGLSKNNKEKEIDSVREIFSKLEYGHREKVEDGESGRDRTTFEIHNPQLHNYLSELGNSREKYIPIEFKNLSARQIKILLDSYISCDGHVVGKGLQISTMSKRLSDDLMECFLKIGVIVSMRPRRVFSHGKDYGKIYGGQYNELGKNGLAKINGAKNSGNVKKYSFDDRVYGLTLKENQTMYVRRAGCATFSGNTKKRQIFERALSFGKPIALLMTNTWLNDRYSKDVFTNAKRDMQLLMFPKRIHFIQPDGKVEKKTTFSSSYYCSDMLNRDIVLSDFVEE